MLKTTFLVFLYRIFSWALVYSCPEHDDNHEECIKYCSINQTEVGKIILHCRTENKIVITWSQIHYNKIDYLIDYRQINDDKWEHNKTVHKNLAHITNISGGYVFRMKPYCWSVPVGEAIESESFFTLPKGLRPSKIRTARVTNFTSAGGYLSATLVWEPVEELVCRYHITVWRKLFGEIEEIDPDIEELYHTRIINLHYSNIYEISLYAKTESKYGKEFIINLVTPSCNEMNGWDYRICAPDKPNDIKIAYEGCIANISWKSPLKPPDFYFVRIVMTNGTFKNLKSYGNESSFNIDTSKFSKYYQVYIEAVANSKQSQKSFVEVENECLLTNEERVEDKSLQESLEDINYVEDNFYVENVFTNKTNKINDVHYKKWLIIVIPLFLTLISVFFLILFHHFLRHKALNRHMHSSKPESKTSVVENKKEINCKSGYDIDSSKLTMLEVIGKGEFGIVSKAMLKIKGKEIIVAVKTLRDNATPEDVESFEEEVEVMRTVGKHENLVSLLGYCQRKRQLVVEYCVLGDMQNFLREARKTKLLVQELLNRDTFNKNSYDPHTGNSTVANNMLYDRTDVEQKHIKLNILDLISFAKQIATGMEYLTNNKIIHRDLATRNILLTHDLVAKISDFGLSRDIYVESVYRKKRVSKLPIKWMAIESLSHHIFTPQSDVWSFGILLWEIMTLGGAPYPSIPSAQVFKLLKSGYRMEKPPLCTSELYKIMTECWKEKPCSRPTFSIIITRLDDALNKLSTYHSDLEMIFINYGHDDILED